MACGKIAVTRKVFYYFYVNETAFLLETVDACYAFSQDTNILDEMFDIIFFRDVFRDEPLRDPNIFIVTFDFEGGDEIKV